LPTPGNERTTGSAGAAIGAARHRDVAGGWQRRRGELGRPPPPTTPNSPADGGRCGASSWRVAVVGGGIVGLAAAWFLQERGAEVTVFERGHIGAGSSSGNAGWLAPALTTPLPEPAVLGYGLRAVTDPASPVYLPQAARGYSFSVPVREMPTGPVYLPEQRVACTPLGDRLRVAGTMEFRHPGEPLDPRRVQAVVDAVRPFLHGLELRKRHDDRGGSRPCTPAGRRRHWRRSTCCAELYRVTIELPARYRRPAVGDTNGRDTNSPAASTVRIDRVYEGRAPDDDARILVDRLWPRGLARDRADLDEWCQQVAPSTALRSWYGHDAEKFPEFQRRYRAELRDPERAEALHHLAEIAQQMRLTLLTATRAVEISAAAVLADVLGETAHRTR
jgi:uncharacterized protein YeaO (DUF488 family)